MRLVFALWLISLSSVVFAQESLEYTPLAQPQWEAMDRDIHTVPMSEQAHQNIRAIMQAYQRDASSRAAEAEKKKKLSTQDPLKAKQP